MSERKICPCGNDPDGFLHSPSCPEKWTPVHLKAPCALPKIYHWKVYNISYCQNCGWVYSR
jgi:hypothetical protein